MAITWVTGFFDFPAPVFEAGRDFWLAVTGYTLSPPRGPKADFATLLPAAGDAYLRVQRTYDGPSGCHLDLHAPDWAPVAERATALGARPVHAEDGLVVFRSPGGLPFCVSAEDGGPAVPAAAQWAGGSVSRVDQFCLDIPEGIYQAECGFWADLTGWRQRDSRRPEFRTLTSADLTAAGQMPIRLLLQRTGDPSGTQIRAHPDLACSGGPAEAGRHQELGATWLYSGANWETMRDPAGLTYCITSREPEPQMMSRGEVRRILDSNRMILTPPGIDEQVKLHINGTDQWISVRGKNRRNPILLFLHGGPASPAMPEAYAFQTPWEDYFTVVHWEQRGSGKTYRANTEAAMAPGMTIEGMADDAVQVARYLREHYQKEKIFLLGHSWGTVLGVHLAQRQADWLYAYISVGQVVNGHRNETLGYDYALSCARDENNTEAIAELESIGPYPGTASLTLERVGVRSKWETYYGAMGWGRKDYRFITDARELSPDYTRDDLDALDPGELFSLNYLLDPVLKVNFDSVTTFGCPVIVYVGAHDFITPHEIAEKWFGDIQAPSKRLVSFAGSAHMIMLEQPGRFLVHLVNDALPLAQAAGDAAPAEVTRDL
jgi:pimeloyl-ACP methyl ester carboxylesterase